MENVLQTQTIKWIDPEKELPSPESPVSVWVKQKNKQQNILLIADYVREKTIEIPIEDWLLDIDCLDYDDRRNAYYLPEGWYEWYCESNAEKIEGTVLCWSYIPMPNILK